MDRFTKRSLGLSDDEVADLLIEGGDYHGSGYRSQILSRGRERIKKRLEKRAKGRLRIPANPRRSPQPMTFDPSLPASSEKATTKDGF